MFPLLNKLRISAQPKSFPPEQRYAETAQYNLNGASTMTASGNAMRRNILLVSTLAAFAVLSGCGGRVAKPVALVQPFDDRLSCEHLAGEFANNEKRLAELLDERAFSNMNNVGLLVTSPLFLDLSDTQKKEALALRARNERLAALMKEKSCSAAPVAAQP